MAWKWTAPRAKAAQRVAEDEMTDADIAAEANISETTLYVWKLTPEFQDRVHEIIANLQKRLERYGIARKDRRLAVVNDRWERAQEAERERARIYGDVGAPAGGTGFVTEALTASGKKYYATDTSLSAECRALETQAAKEMGQLTEKREQAYTGKDGTPVDPIDLIRAVFHDPLPS